MGRKIVSLLLILGCVALFGCKQAPAENTASNTESSAFTEETVAAGSEATGETVLPTESQNEPMVEEDVLWTPICNEYISMWSTPGGSRVLTQIPLGETLQLKEWAGKYALVSYNGTDGYVYSNCIQPTDPDYFTKVLKAVTPTTLYSYEQMQADLEELQAMYPGLVRLSSIGTSELGKQIPVMTVGDMDAKYHVLIQGAMHAREHFTAWLAVAIADHALLYSKLDDGICYHIIPMSNPDGVAISQTGKLDSVQEAIYQHELDYEYTNYSRAYYAEQWKANAMGIDLNRNFASGWEIDLDRSSPSSEKYHGEEPFCAAESKALRDYTYKYDFDATISIHSHGSVIYYQFGNKQPVNRLSYSFAQAIEKITGYIPTAYDNTHGAGYKDWVMAELGIPSLTLEIGNFETPLVQRDIYNTFYRCRGLLPEIYDWLSQN